MGFAKYFEDDQEIIEERYMMRQQENKPTFFYRTVPPSKSEVLIISTTVKIKTVPASKHKKPSKRIECVDCGAPFLFSGGEQTYYEKHKLHEPKRCAVCRKKQRERNRTI